MADIDKFLGDGDEGAHASDEPSQAVDAGADAKPEAAERDRAAVESTPPPDAKDAKPAADAPSPDDDKPVPEDVLGLRQAIQAERAKRNDYKGERDRLAGEMAALKAELEARKTAAVPPPPPAAQVEQRREPQQIPNPIEDPAGYHAYIQHDIWNRSLNMSEVMLRQAVGDDADVDAKVAAFKKMAEANPTLRAELARQPHPYKYVYDYAKKQMALEEIGDPEAYRAKLAADIRAELEAEYAGTPVQQAQMRQPPRVNIPQSLGTARSAQSRSTPVLNIPESFGDILGRR